MIVTKEFVLAVTEGLQALRAQADELEKDPLYKHTTPAGFIVRSRCESTRQQADLLSGWVRRNAAEAGVNPETLEL